jgi:HAD superfamily hydrolase (TIGR01549 family)
VSARAAGVEAVTFDFFNTLARHRDARGRGSALMDYLAAHGLESGPWEHGVLYDVFEPHAREYDPGLPAAARRTYHVRMVERLFARMDVRGASRPGEHAAALWSILGPAGFEVFPDVVPALDRLQAAGIRTAIISNWQCGLGHFCVDLGLRDRVEHVVASAEVGCEKPARAIFDGTCQLLGVPAGGIVHVGDTWLDDVEGALGAGLRPVHIVRAGVQPVPGAVPDEPGANGVPTIRTLDELFPLLGLDGHAGRAH